MNSQNNLRLQQVCVSDENMSCALCGGQVVCEPWCETVNAGVRYAHDAVLHPSHLSIGDRIILHGLGVRWTAQHHWRKKAA
ncbi:MAG TPA: hypothetical protein VK670_14000 [Silvibacterium sp.]|nr:hypothetical protein [Silvibacterium sp.]